MEIIEIETKKQQKKLIKVRAEKINKIHKPLARLTKRKINRHTDRQIQNQK